MSWTKEPPIKAKMRGCALAPMFEIAPMDEIIAVGFGDAHVEKDGEIVYKEPLWEFQDTEDVWTFQDAEDEALKDPDHDWRVVLYAPLRGRVFQRHEPGKWVLIEENMGFA